MLNNKKGISLIILVLIVVAVIAILAVTIVLVMNKDNPVINDNNLQISEDNNSQIIDDNNHQNSDREFYEEWGSSASWIAGKTAESKPFYINFPKYAGYTEGYGLVAEQTDGTCVIVASEYDYSPLVEDLKDFLPAYFSDIQYTLEKIYGLISENYQFKVESNKAVTIGEYSMHAFEGTFSFDEAGKHNEYQYVVYATQLKSNGAYAYWVVYDVSENQSNGNLIKEHALNMAKTFREEK